MTKIISRVNTVSKAFACIDSLDAHSAKTDQVLLSEALRSRTDFLFFLLSSLSFLVLTPTVNLGPGGWGRGEEELKRKREGEGGGRRNRYSFYSLA